MYRFKYHDNHVEKMLSDRKTFWDPELEGELSPVLDKLKQTGEIAGAICGFNLIAPGRIYYTLTGRTFQLAYTVDSCKKEIQFYEFQQVSHQIDWETALEKDLRDGEEQPIYIPQIGYPIPLIQARKVAFQTKTLYLEELCKRVGSLLAIDSLFCAEVSQC